MRSPALWIVFLPLLAAAFVPGNAQADGLPVLGVDVGGVGVITSSGDARYVTLPAKHATVLARVRPAGGRVVASRLLPGTLTIPAVAYDGSASGLSADGRTLVLIEPRVGFPRARTKLVALDTRSLRQSRVIRLPGDFSFDAISPRGSLLYLIQYVSPQDPTRYVVRVYDLARGRLLARPVADPAERGAEMHGSPLTRVSSPDGRWAYTLYDGAGKTPFVHALDTSTHSARCIDLPTLALDNLSRLRLSVDRSGGTLVVSRRRRPLVVIGTRTFHVSPAAAPEGSPGDAKASRAAWPTLGLASGGTLIAAAAASGVLRLLRGRRRAPGR